MSRGERRGQEQVGHGKNRAAWVTPKGAVSAQLLKVTGGSDASFLLKFARGGLICLFAAAQKTAR